MTLNTDHLKRCIGTLEGEGFAKETLVLLPAFIADAKLLETVLRDRFANGE